MIATSNQRDDVKLAAMQRVFQPNKRLASTLSLFDDDADADLEDLLSNTNTTQNAFEVPRNKTHCASSTAGTTTTTSQNFVASRSCTTCEFNVDNEQLEILQQSNLEINAPQTEVRSHNYIELDASELQDFPARYVIPRIDSHQFPAIGVYIDKRIVPGFKYRVRPLPDLYHVGEQSKCLFDGNALTLKSIGRGYARRFTLNDEKRNVEEHFWSDNRPEGYAFELEVISDCDKFTVFDANGEEQGTAEVVKIEGAQLEIAGGIIKNGFEKRVKVKFIAKVEFYETGVAKPMPLSGVAICLKKKGTSRAEIMRVINININHHRYYFIPGYRTNQRKVTVRGQDIGDVPTKYTMTGLEPYEMPVVGTYVDPRIIPGFYYRVRPNDRNTRLFNGRGLKLQSIGIGYAKKLTFEPDSALKQDNYLWSDNHPDGLGLEPRAVRAGMKFYVIADGKTLGEASVFRADLPQIEERMEKVPTDDGRCAIVKYIHVNVMCHLKLTINGTRREEQLLKVYGLAVVRKEPHANKSRIIRVENVGLDSQLYLLFVRNHTELTFVPIP